MYAEKASLTVLFEEPFWIGIYERSDGKKCEVCKITFGAEPKDYEVYDFILKNWSRLKFSPPVKETEHSEKAVNPKRLQRKIKKVLQNTGIGTKAQQALKLGYEQGKLARKSDSAKRREAEAERQFELKQHKKKEKHKGH